MNIRLRLGDTPVWLNNGDELLWLSTTVAELTGVNKGRGRVLGCLTCIQETWVINRKSGVREELVRQRSQEIGYDAVFKGEDLWLSPG